MIPAAIAAVGAVGQALQKPPKRDSSALSSLSDLITSQETGMNNYFNEADASLESQYKNYYSDEMNTAFNDISNAGIYDSPVGQKQINRTMTALGETYSNAKSALAGQRLQAESDIAGKKVDYYSALNQQNYENATNSYNRNVGIYSSIAGLGASMFGAK